MAHMTYIDIMQACLNKRPTSQPKTIKQVIPFDTLTVPEEYEHTQRRTGETITVRLGSLVVERIYRKLRDLDKTVFYNGRQREILGTGFNRWIDII